MEGERQLSPNELAWEEDHHKSTMDLARNLYVNGLTPGHPIFDRTQALLLARQVQANIRATEASEAAAKAAADTAKWTRWLAVGTVALAFATVVLAVITVVK